MPLKNAPEKCQEKTPLKIGVERREVRDPKVQAHLQATLDMLNERHGNAFKFTLLVRHEMPCEGRDGEVYIVSNDRKLPLVRDVLSEVLGSGILGDPNDEG